MFAIVRFDGLIGSRPNSMAARRTNLRPATMFVLKTKVPLNSLSANSGLLEVGSLQLRAAEVGPL